MKFEAFHAALEAARAAVAEFEGSHNFPGLSVHDRIYALPVDWQGEHYTAIVRSAQQLAHVANPVQIEVWHWHWRGGKDAKFENLNDEQLRAIADIKRSVRRWITGEIDELPPSTCSRWKVPS